MIIWFALIIPIVTAVIMAALFRHKIAWWEYGMPLVVSFLLIGMCKGCSEAIQTRDTEYWGGYITSATYYEDWNERVSCRHPKYRTERRTRTVTDSRGRSRTESYTVQVQDGYHHPYDVDYHPERWVAETSNGDELSISSDTWRYYTEVFENRTFRELNRDYHTNDGDAYDTVWNQKFETVQPVVTTHTYENRVQASNSVFNYKELTDKEKKGLIDYVYEGPLQTPSVLPEGIAGADHIDKMNALLGRKHQIRVWVLLYRDQPRDISKRQEALWKGGNKNELVICVGLNKANEVQWAEVFSWTKREDLKVSVRDYIQAQKKLDLVALTPFH
jgi:hypothetical protein